MANACAKCNGMGFGEVDPDFGYRANAVPCPKCNPEGNGVPPAAPRKAPMKTVQGVDGPVSPSKANETGMTLDEAVEQGVFGEEEAAQSIADELAASAAESAAPAAKGKK